MFHSIKQDPISFVSNPPLDPAPRIQLKIRDDGSPDDEIVVTPRDHHGFFEGVHYDPKTMSLTARLNLGIPLQEVSIGCTENDPNVLYRKTNDLIYGFRERYSQNVQQAQAAAAESTVKAPKVESES